MDASPAADALCAADPERPSVATCGRCGSFMCGECRSEELPDRCAACASRLEQGRFVSQVPMLGVVMIVHGVLVGGLGLYLLVFGGFFAQSVASAPAAPQDPFAGFMVGAISFIGLLHMVPGVLQVWAGLRVRAYRSRGLGFVALGLGLVTVLGCYCSPTSIALLIWGAIVLVHEDVSARFAATRGSGT
jgi:hypothetical protein